MSPNQNEMGHYYHTTHMNYIKLAVNLYPWYIFFTIFMIRHRCFKQWLSAVRELAASCAYHKISNISRTLVGNKLVDHSDVVGASPVGAAPTTPSFSTYCLASMDLAKITARRDENHLNFVIWCGLYWRFYGMLWPHSPTRPLWVNMWHRKLRQSCS